MRPIETVYAGHRFRSRLEARWAVFFDALCIKWEYEPEGYHLSDGSMYLPDFWLPGFHLAGGTFVEVKPEGGSVSKAQQFARDSGAPVLLAVGAPDMAPLDCLFTDIGDDGEARLTTYTVAFDSKYLPCNQSRRENRFFVCPSDDHCDGDELLLNAVVAARQARFEHGQVGAPSAWPR